MKKRAVAYLRVSNEAGSGLELGRQREQIERYARQQGYRLVEVYLDTCPGVRQQRPGLTRLMADAQAGVFDVVLVTDLTRLFRDPDMAERYQRWLGQDRVRLESLSPAAGVEAQ